MSVLVISNWEKDAHVSPVARELARRGVDTFVFNPAVFPCSASITTEASVGGQRSTLAWSEHTLELGAIGAVWYRRPDLCQVPEGLLPAEAEWLALECRQFIDGLWATMNARWVSDPERLRTANLKLLQLRVSRSLGFRVPDSIVTNDPGRARAFIEAHPGGVIAKALGLPGLDVPGCGSGAIYTHRLTPDDLDHLDSVRHGPTFFQTFVPKLRDIRVTVIGQRVFAVGIESGDIPAAAVDFRVPEPWGIPHVPLQLPPPLEDACRALVRRFGLEFGAIDLLESPGGEYTFLEINPNGQWLWIELMTGLPLAAAMADLLEAGLSGKATASQPVPTNMSRTLPVGTHTIAIPAPAVAGGDNALSGLVGTRVWLEQQRGSVLLHIGDVETAEADGGHADAGGEEGAT